MALLKGILAGQFPAGDTARDTRPVHRHLFAGLAPVGHEYYVGNYRGSHQKCLRTYEVEVGGDRLACVPAAEVLDGITRLGRAIADGVEAVDQAIAKSGMPASQRTVAIVRLACDAFVKFLTVHPYADGNGHTARALMWMVLFHFGYVPNGWTIDPRPPFPSYADMIARHRRGDSSPLEQFVLARISAVAP